MPVGSSRHGRQSATAERSRIEVELTCATAAVIGLIEAYQEDLLSLDAQLLDREA